MPSVMGIHTIDPAGTAYELVTPVFDRITIRLDRPYRGKTFTIETSGAAPARPYIQSVQRCQQWRGLEVDLGPKPNRPGPWHRKTCRLR